MKLETAFTMDTSSIKYGPGATREIGCDMQEQGCRRVMVVTDPNLSAGSPVAVTLEALRERGIDSVLYDQASVEPRFEASDCRANVIQHVQVLHRFAFENHHPFVQCLHAPAPTEPSSATCGQLDSGINAGRVPARICAESPCA